MRDSNKTKVGFEYKILLSAQDRASPPTISTDPPPEAIKTSVIKNLSENDPMLDIPPQPDIDEQGFISCTGSKADFGFLMQQMYVILDAYAAAVPQDEHSLLWRSWQQKGLAMTSDFQQLKRILDISSLDQFYLFLRDCSPITTVLDVAWDNKILFRMALPITPTSDDMSSITTLNKEKGFHDIVEYKHMVTPATPTKSVGEIHCSTAVYAGLDLKPPPAQGYLGITKVTPKTSNFATPVVTTVPAATSDRGRDTTDEIRDSFTVNADDAEHSYRFIVFHSSIFDRIHAWTNTEEAKSHPFRTKWQNWVCRGLDRYRDFSAVRRILGIGSLQEYLTTIKECPMIPHSIHWMWQGQILHYMFLDAKDATDFRLSRQAKAIDKEVDIAVKEGSRRVQEIFSSQMAAFNLQLKTAARTAVQSFRDDIQAEVTRLEMESSKTMTRFAVQLSDAADSATEKAQQDLYVTLDQLTESLNAQAQALVANISTKEATSVVVQDTPSAQTKQYTTWRGLKIDASARPQPDLTPPSTHFDDQSLKKYGQYEDPSGLPPLQYDYVLKRVTAAFTGPEDIVVFYNQLMNGSGPYGLFMNKLTDVRKTMSVCPKEFNGVPITTTRYDQMAGCLYQKLTHIDTIPLEFTAARNQVNRFAEENDGYAAMLAILDPILHQEDILTAPKSNEWSDIYEYALKVQSYFKCETLAGRLCTQREQCKIFLNGLAPQFKPAVRRARNLLDTGNKTDPHVPEALKIAILPATIERYLTEETGLPTVRAMMHTNTREERNGHRPYKHDRGDRNGSRNKEDRDRGPKSDKTCSICFHYGHPRSQCNAFAKFLALRYAETKLDTQQRDKIIEAYRAESKKKAEIRTRRQHLGTVRELWDMGKSYEEVEHQLMEAMPAITGGEDSSEDESDSE